MGILGGGSRLTPEQMQALLSGLGVPPAEGMDTRPNGPASASDNFRVPPLAPNDPRMNYYSLGPWQGAGVDPRSGMDSRPAYIGGEPSLSMGNFLNLLRGAPRRSR